MEFFAQLSLSNRYMIFYIIGISVLRGLVVPDFRYGYFSIAIIQVVYPMLLLLPLLVARGVHMGYWGYFILGFAGIVLSQISAVSRYFLEFGGNALDSVSGAIIVLSFTAMTVMLMLMLALVIHWKS